MPLLGRDYIDAVVADIETHYPQLAPVDANALAAAFSAFGHRPPPFTAAIGDGLNPMVSASPIGLERGVLGRALARQAEERAQMSADYIALDPLTRLVLWRLLALRERFRPYDAEAIAFYRERLRESGTERAAGAQAVQGAIRKLRQGTPPLIRKSARGEYAPEDAAMHAWYDELNSAGAWPPRE